MEWTSNGSESNLEGGLVRGGRSPADKQVLNELRKSIKEFEDNLGQDGDRVCVSLVGKTLLMKSAKVPIMQMDKTGKLHPQLII